MADVDQQAQERLVTIIRQMAQAQKINETLKTAYQITWMGWMSNIRVYALEDINEEIIQIINKAAEFILCRLLISANIKIEIVIAFPSKIRLSR